LESAAQEPEVVDLAEFPEQDGAKIEGARHPPIIVEGVKELHGTEHDIIPTGSRPNISRGRGNLWKRNYGQTRRAKAC